MLLVRSDGDKHQIPRIPRLQISRKPELLKHVKYEPAGGGNWLFILQQHQWPEVFDWSHPSGTPPGIGSLVAIVASLLTVVELLFWNCFLN